MKLAFFALSGIIALLPLKDPNTKKSFEQSEVVVLESAPVNNFLDIRVNDQLFTDASNKSLKYDVKVFNVRGDMVYSSIKEVNKFSIFTGGLVDGNYVLSLKVDTLQFRRDFNVKH